MQRQRQRASSLTSYDDERVNGPRDDNTHLPPRDVIATSPYATLGRRGHVARSQPISAHGSLPRPRARARLAGGMRDIGLMGPDFQNFLRNLRKILGK